MLTKTLPAIIEEVIPETPEMIQKAVDERGFYLYEWISPDELRMTAERDYLQVVRASSIPLAIITGIAAFIGFAGGIFGSLMMIFGVLTLFYLLVFFGLFIAFIRRAYIYTRGANVVMTDNHYVSSGKIIEKNDSESLEKYTQKIGAIFDEPFLEESKLAQRKDHAKSELYKNLKEIAFGGGKIIEKVGRSRDSGGIILVIILAGIVYGSMMALVYFIGILFITFFGRIFSWMAHRYLLATSNTEHKIQTLFSRLDRQAHSLQKESHTSLSLLSEAGDNAWKENLLGKINDSLSLLSNLAGSATDESRDLRSILESSQYKEIFNFVKYGNWVKKQILEPIESILLLLEKNRAILERTIVTLEDEARNTADSSLQKPLLLQKERLEMQKESFDRNIKVLTSYKEKLS